MIFYLGFDTTTELIDLPRKMELAEAAKNAKRIGESVLGIINKKNGQLAMRAEKDIDVINDIKAKLDPELAQEVGDLWKTPAAQGRRFVIKGLDSSLTYIQTVQIMKEIKWKIKPERFLKTKHKYINNMVVFAIEPPNRRVIAIQGTNGKFLNIVDFIEQKPKQNAWQKAAQNHKEKLQSEDKKPIRINLDEDDVSSIEDEEMYSYDIFAPEVQCPQMFIDSHQQDIDEQGTKAQTERYPQQEQQGTQKKRKDQFEDFMEQMKNKQQESDKEFKKVREEQSRMNQQLQADMVNLNTKFEDALKDMVKGLSKTLDDNNIKYNEALKEQNVQILSIQTSVQEMISKFSLFTKRSAEGENGKDGTGPAAKQSKVDDKGAPMPAIKGGGTGSSRTAPAGDQY
jgi:hypothetical protein